MPRSDTLTSVRRSLDHCHRGHTDKRCDLYHIGKKPVQWETPPRKLYAASIVRRLEPMPSIFAPIFTSHSAAQLPNIWFTSGVAKIVVVPLASVADHYPVGLVPVIEASSRSIYVPVSRGCVVFMRNYAMFLHIQNRPRTLQIKKMRKRRRRYILSPPGFGANLKNRTMTEQTQNLKDMMKMPQSALSVIINAAKCVGSVFR